MALTMPFEPGEGESSEKGCQKVVECQLGAPEAPFFLLWILWETLGTHPSDEEQSGTYDLLGDNLGTPSWLHQEERSPIFPSLVGVPIHLVGGGQHKSRRGKRLNGLTFPGLVVWLSWQSTWLACKKPWVPPLASQIISTQKVEGRRFLTTQPSFHEIMSQNIPIPPTLCISTYLFPCLLWLIKRYCRISWKCLMPEYVAVT